MDLSTFCHTVDLGDGFRKGLIDLVQSPEFADFTIECGNQSWKINSFVLSAYSPFFKRICLGPFKDGQERKVSLVDDDLSAVKAMVEFFTTVRYSRQEGEIDLLLHAKVFNLADKYDIEDLKAFALDVCGYTLAVNTFTSTQSMIQALLAATPEAYGGAPSDDRFRHIVRRMWGAKAWDGVPAYIIASQADLKSLNTTTPALGYDMVHYVTTPQSFVTRDIWSVTASRFYQYLRGSMRGSDWGDNFKDKRVSVTDVAQALQLSTEEVLQAAMLMKDEVPRAIYYEGKTPAESFWLHDSGEIEG